MTRVWAFVKIFGVLGHIFLVAALLLSCNPWSDLGVGRILDSLGGKIALGCFLFVLGVAYYKTAFMHAFGKAFEAAGWLFGLVGVLIGAWGMWQLCSSSNWTYFDLWWNRALLLFVVLLPVSVGGQFNRPPDKEGENSYG